MDGWTQTDRHTQTDGQTDRQTDRKADDGSLRVQVLPTIPQDQRTRVAHFLEKQGFKQQALAVSTDIDHK